MSEACRRLEYSAPECDDIHGLAREIHEIYKRCPDDCLGHISERRWGAEIVIELVGSAQRVHHYGDCVLISDPRRPCCDEDHSNEYGDEYSVPSKSRLGHC